MKKRLISLAAFGAMTLSGFAQTESVYTLNGFGDDILDLFSAALDKGRKYPTPEEFEAAGYDLTELNFVRSHVRPRSIMVDHSKDVNQNVQEGRKLWMNVPIGMGKHQGGYPSTNFSDDTFTGWNYTNVFGSWNHALFHVPAVATDCAHKNGSDIYSGIKFFESWTPGSGAAGWVGKVQTKDASRYGGYKYVEPLINALMFFGQDGINYNFEDSGYEQADVVGFHQAAYRLAKERGFNNFHIGIYTQTAAIANQNFCKAVLGTTSTGKTADAFLNYSGGDFAGSMTTQSANNAERWFGDASDVYQGAWIVTMARTWSYLNKDAATKKLGVVLWGEHSQSRLFSYNQGYSPTNFEDNYQKLQERFFSGGNRNPATRPTPTNGADWGDGLATFQGLAEYIPERTAIQQNLPFTTYFNIGSGERYNYKGNRTHGAWYNLGQQDVVPTYRWLVYGKDNTTPQTSGIPEFTTDDAYIGGSCLRLTNTQAIDVTLYRTKLTVSAANPRVTVALKQPVTGADAEHVNHPTQQADLSVIVKTVGNNTWKETKLSRVEGNDWQDQTVALSGIKQGDVIEYVGLRTAGNTQGLLVGQLTLNDDSQVTPAPVKDVVVEVKDPSATKFSVKMRWDVNATATTRADYGLVYNDEAGIDHFEVLYKNGADGRVCELARTTTWSAFVGNIELPTEGDAEPYIGVRSASVDGKTYSEIIWQALPDLNKEGARAEYAEIKNDPAKGTTDRYLKSLGYSENNRPFMKNWTEAPAGGYQLLDKTFTVSQGQTLNYTLTFNGDISACTARGYADWDGDHTFTSAPDEAIWDGTTGYNSQYNRYSLSVKVPSDARLGESCIRVVFSEQETPVQPTEQLYTIKLAGTNYYFTTVTKPSTQNTTYTLQTEPETFRITKSGTGYTIQSAKTDLWAGYNSTTSWDFYNKQSVWYINSLEGAETTILTSTKSKGFGCDDAEVGAGVYTDKSSGYNKWIIEPYVAQAQDTHPGSKGLMTRGYALDIPVNITGSNPERELPTVGDDDKYLASYLDPESEGANIAVNNRWFASLRSTGATQNINCSWTSSPEDGSNYVLADQTIKAAQGASVTLSWTDGSQSDGFKYCTGRAYGDWDCNGYFNGATMGNDELIWYCGESNSKKANDLYTTSFGFTIPTDAVPGESRVRIVLSDAWFPHPGSSGMTQKGFTIDIPLEITGTNPARKPALDTHDLYDWLQPDGCWLWGDMNDDGRLTIGDVTDVISLLLGRPSATVRRKKAAEINGTVPADAPHCVADKVLEWK